MILKNKDLDALDSKLYNAAEEFVDGDEELFDSLNDSAVELGDELNEKIAAIIDGGKEKQKEKRTAETLRRIGFRASVAAVALAILLVPLMMNVSAKTRDEWRVRCDELEFFYVIRYIPELYDENSARIEPPKTLETVRTPYVSVKDIIKEERLTDTEYTCVYEYGGKEYMSFQQKVLTIESLVAVTSTSGTVTTVDIGGYDGLLFEYSHSDTKFLFWNDGEYAYKMQSGCMTSNEMVHSASRMK